jgi:hypothetical protein
MALADLMKRGFLISATATVATPATNKLLPASTVATAADVAVAKHNAKITEKEKLAKMLSAFRFDLLQKECDEGYPAAEMHRVNDMAYEFMQADGIPFEHAIRLAAEIVANLNVAACEAGYTKVFKLFNKIKS